MGLEMDFEYEPIEILYKWDLLEQITLTVWLFILTLAIWGIYKFLRKLWKGGVK